MYKNSNIVFQQKNLFFARGLQKITWLWLLSLVIGKYAVESKIVGLTIE